MALIMNGIENTLPVVGSKFNREEAGYLKGETLTFHQNKTTCLATDGLYRF